MAIQRTSGHGQPGAAGREAALVVEDRDGLSAPLAPAPLGELFRILGDDIRVVVLNACYSSAQAEVIRQHVDAVVGMTGALGDRAATAFAGAFYQALGFGRAMGTAFDLGKNQIGITGLGGDDAPCLWMRPGVDAAKVYLTGDAPADPVRVAPPRPAFPDAATQALSDQLADARRRQRRLRLAGADTGAIDQQILDLKRRIRDGGQLRAGDALGEGRYLLLDELGRGGFGVVWRAHDEETGEIVALKVLHGNLAGDVVRRSRFARGARLMREIEHEAVVRVIREHEEDSGLHYFVMEHLPGGDLRRAVLEKRIAGEAVIPLLLPICDAVAVAHRRGGVHRDIKPANILLDAAGELKLTDFDLVSVLDTTGGTRTGALGSVLYTAPEAIDRPDVVDPRADVYSLGMTAVFALYGEVPGGGSESRSTRPSTGKDAPFQVTLPPLARMQSV